LEFDAFLTSEEASRGERVELEIPVPKPCPECRGTGRFAAFDCPACEGTGEYRIKETARIDLPPGVLPETTFRATISLQREKCLHLLIHVHIIQTIF
jgi:DnaJ-class molecular chaperone